MTIAEKSALFLGVDYTSNTHIFDLLAEMVADEVKAYCNITEIPNELVNTQVQMICHKYNSRHGSGLSGATYSGVREDYREKYTADIYAALNRYRKVKLI